MTPSIRHVLQRSLAAIALAASGFVSSGFAFAADVPPTPPPDKGERRGVVQACRADAERLCGSVEKGGGRKLACLREHEAQLTPTCRDDLAQMTANRKNVAPK